MRAGCGLSGAYTELGARFFSACLALQSERRIEKKAFRLPFFLRPGDAGRRVRGVPVATTQCQQPCPKSEPGRGESKVKGATVGDTVQSC